MLINLTASITVRLEFLMASKRFVHVRPLSLRFGDLTVEYSSICLPYYELHTYIQNAGTSLQTCVCDLSNDCVYNCSHTSNNDAGGVSSEFGANFEEYPVIENYLHSQK